MTMKLRKAVFPVAGLGTRFLPATKANPKEMLPIVDKPLIQYAAEEAIAAGIDELIFVTSSSKRAIEDHFDKNLRVGVELDAAGKQDLLRIVHEVLPEGVSCVYIRQPEALGLGHAVLCAEPVVARSRLQYSGRRPYRWRRALLLGADAVGLRPAPMQRAGGRARSALRDRQIRHREERAHRERVIGSSASSRSPGRTTPLPIGGCRTLHSDAADLRLCWTTPRAAPAARSSSPMLSPHFAGAGRLVPTSSRASATIAAASSAILRPRSSTH